MKTLKNKLLLILLISVFSCKSKPEPKLELFNPQAFAFDVGGSWEVNATVNAKGFAQKEVNEEFLIKLSYSVDLITEEKDTLKKIFTDTLSENQKTEFEDIQIETQIELDSSFGFGKYELIFNVLDKYTEQTKSTKVKFSLKPD